MDINKTPCKDMYVGQFLKGEYFGFNDRYNDPGKYAISYCENTASYGVGNQPSKFGKDRIVFILESPHKSEYKNGCGYTAMGKLENYLIRI